MGHKNVMLAVHCKSGETLDIVAPLRNYIALNYGDSQGSDSNDDLEVVAGLRTAVINQTGGLSQLRDKLAKYYAVLCMMESRFPIAKGSGNVDISFKWHDAFKATKVAEQTNIYFEKASVLFNLGAVASQQGLQVDRNAEDGPKDAARRFQEAAGYFALLRDRDSLRVDAPRPVDVTPEAAGMLERLMLAQAQECFFEKARNDKKSPGIIARIAQQASVFYGEVQRKLGQQPLQQHFDRAWVAHVSAKGSLYAVEALMRSAEQLAADDDLQGCGKGLARLKEAFNELQTAKKEAKLGGKELSDWVAKVEEEVTVKYNRLLRENETVYLQRIPDPSTLPTIQGAPMVKPLAPEGLGGAAAGVDRLFHGIVPDTSAKAVSRYTELVDDVCRSALDKLEAASDEARLRLREWEMPECLDCLAAGTSSVLPEGLRAELEALEANGGVQHLTDLAQQLRELRRVCEGELASVADQLEREATEDEELRGRFGVRWTRPPSAALAKPLHDKLMGYRGNIAAAGESDAKLFRKLEDNSAGLSTLSMDAAVAAMPRLQAPMVAVADVDPPLIVNTLRQALDAINQLSNQRAALEEAIKEEKVKDDILPRLMAAGAGENPEALFKQELSKYDPLVAEVDANAKKQTEVLSIIAKHQALFRSVFSYPDWRKACEASCAGLRSQLTMYREVRDNLSEGARFYSALQDAVKGLNQQAGDYCLTRRIQRDDLLSDLQRERETHSQAAAAQLAAMSMGGAAGSYAHGPQPPAPSYSGPPPPTGAPAYGEYGGYGQPPAAAPAAAPPPPAGAPAYPSYGHQQQPAYGHGTYGQQQPPHAAATPQPPPGAYAQHPGAYGQPAASYAQPQQHYPYQQQQQQQQAPQYYQNPASYQQAPPQQQQQRPGSPGPGATHNPLWGKR